MRELLEKDTLDARTMWAALGGVRGLVESTLPGVVFIIVQTATRQVVWSTVASLALVAGFTLARLIARQPLAQAMSGLVGVLLGAVLALVTGRAVQNYLPGIVINAVSALVLLGSLVVRWPLVSVLVAVFRGDVTLARQRLLLRAGALATGVWALISVARLAVQLPLYLHSLTDDEVTALGTAKLLMGLPLLALGVLLTWLLLRPVIAVLDAAEGEPDGESTTDVGTAPDGSRAGAAGRQTPSRGAVTGRREGCPDDADDVNVRGPQK